MSMFFHVQGRLRKMILAGLVGLIIIAGVLSAGRFFTPQSHNANGAPGVGAGPVVNGALAARDLNWTDPNAWQGQRPVAGASVVIPAGRSIVLDTNPPHLKSLTIQGTLTCAERDLQLYADWILIPRGGTLQCGSEMNPFRHQLVITLTGNNPAENIMTMGTKVLGVMGGRLELHGLNRVSWVHLAATATAGSSRLQLDKPVDWKKGNRIVIASTDYDPLQAEEVVIKSVSGTNVTLTKPLRYIHWGQLQLYAARSVDERAEVGLLSHNIVIQGDTGSVNNGFGGQAMFMRFSQVHIAGVEFYHMGQFKRLARYPVHWHMAGDAPGDYIQDSAVDHSFNRCITIHGTNDVLVRDNVAFDTIGHCYFMEDGSEVNNVLEANLGLLTRKAPDGQNLLPSDVRPATFWITNPNNIVRDNVAAGSQSQGFWYALPNHPTGFSSYKTSIWPRQTPLGEFSNNVAHSNGEAGLFVDDGPNPNGTVDGYYYAPVKQPGSNSRAVDAVFQNFTAYKQGFLGVWMRGYHLHLSGAVLADNGDGAIFAADNAFLENSLVVGETANKGNPTPGETRGLDGRSLPAPWAADTPLNGFSFYDGLVGVKNVTFVNFKPNSQRPAGALSYLRGNANPIDVLNYAQGIHLQNANPVYLAKPRQDGDRAAVFLDVDGSVTGLAGQYVTANNPLLADGTCSFQASWNSYICKRHYVNLSLESSGQSIAPLTIDRDDGVTASQSGMDGSYTSVSALPAHDYTFHFAQPTTSLQIDLQHARSGDWVVLAIPSTASHLRLYRDAEQNSPITAASSLSSFNASQGSLYYRDQAKGVIYIKLLPRAGNDWARVNVEAN